jgi:hypothetical protein
MLEGIAGRGFECVQAIILAYQVAELMPFVKTLEEVRSDLAGIARTVEEINELWISDKHCPVEILETYSLPESYKKYSVALRENEELPDFYIKDKRDTPSHPHFHPCLVAWRFDKAPDIDKFIAAFESCLNLPAKFAFTDALYAFMERNSNHWVNLGQLNRTNLPSEFSEEEKTLHRAKKSDLAEQVAKLQLNVSRERAVSPRTTTPSPRLTLQFETARERTGSEQTSLSPRTTLQFDTVRERRGSQSAVPHSARTTLIFNLRLLQVSPVSNTGLLRPITDADLQEFAESSVVAGEDAGAVSPLLDRLFTRTSSTSPFPR